MRTKEVQINYGAKMAKIYGLTEAGREKVIDYFLNEASQDHGHPGFHELNL